MHSFVQHCNVTPNFHYKSLRREAIRGRLEGASHSLLLMFLNRSIFKFTGYCVHYISCLRRSDLWGWYELGAMLLENRPGVYLEWSSAELRLWDASLRILWRDWLEWKLIALQCAVWRFAAQILVLETGGKIGLVWTISKQTQICYLEPGCLDSSNGH